MDRQAKTIYGVTTSAKARILDERGWFLPALTEHEPTLPWVLQNITRSHPNTLRGLHYQDPYPQNKLITVLEGTVQDIVADLRPDSPTYQQFAVYYLDAHTRNQIFIPKGCAHGFLVTGSEPALVAYLADAPYRPEAEKTLLWNHPDWNFPWLNLNPILSPKDQDPPRTDDPIA